MPPNLACASCGAKYTASDQYCPECGVLLDQTVTTKTQPCPDCDRLISPHAEACPGCGRFIQNIRRVVIVERKGWANTIAGGIILASIISAVISIVLFVLFWFLIFASIAGSMSQPINLNR